MELHAARPIELPSPSILPSPWGASSPGRKVSLTSRPYVVHIGLTPHTLAFPRRGASFRSQRDEYLAFKPPTRLPAEASELSKRVEIVRAEEIGEAVTEEQREFRNAWLSSPERSAP